MPNFDKTGPQGAGPNTGQGRGSCNPSQNSQPQRGFGKGCGRRNRRRCCDPLPLEEETAMLKSRLKEIENLQNND